MDQQNEIQHNSLEQQMNGVEDGAQQPIDEEIQQIDYGMKIEQIHQMISKLSEQEEILKETLKFKERQLLDTFHLLDERKKCMQTLLIDRTNSTQIQLDIALSQQFEELRTIIGNQKKQIDQLKDQISKQGLSGRNNDQDFIRVYTKIPQVQKEIQVGRKFASTQFVRDYFDKPQVYKVAYEEVKYEFQIRTKIKESLQQEKQHYNLKKEEIIKAMTRQKQIQQQLLKEKDILLKQLNALS